MNRVLNATVQRTADHAAPEISLDPLEIVGGKQKIHVNFYISTERIVTQWLDVYVLTTF